jgi:integrase
MRILHKEYEGFLKDQAHVKPSTLHLLRAKLRVLPDPDKLTGVWFRKRMKKVSPSTIKHEVGIAKRFLKWSKRDYSELTTESLKLPRIEDTVTVADLYTKKELAAIFSHCNNTRDRAMLEVLYESAARANELLSMAFKNTTFNEDGTVTTIISGKTGTRPVPLYQSVHALKTWLNVHPTGKGPIWLTQVRPYRSISARHLHHTLEMALDRAGVRGKKKLVHMMRHTRATELVRLGVRGQVLSKLMGWTKKSNMEAVYVHLSTEDVTNEIHAKVFGIGTKDEAPRPLLESMICPRCDTKNDQNTRFCSKCSMPISNDAIVQALDKQEMIIQLDARIDSLEYLLYASFKRGEMVELEIPPDLLKELESAFGGKWQDRAREGLFEYMVGYERAEAEKKQEPL